MVEPAPTFDTPPESDHPTGPSRLARWRTIAGRLALVCLAVYAAWAIATAALPGVAAATEGAVAFAMLGLFVFVPLWALCYVAGTIRASGAT